MSKNRYSARADANQPEIVKQLREMGATVQTGMDDLLVGWKGKTFWFEIKDPEKTLTKKGEWTSTALKPAQIKLCDEWKGHYRVVHSIEQIIKELNS
jgi:hypothetical protein